MAFQSCTPADCYGPLQQHVFLGASLTNFSASAGWNEQAGELVVELVEDECAGQKIYYDNNLTLQSGSFADPGFLGKTQDIIGRPVYFAFVASGTTPDFEFAGIIQSWDSKESAGGKDILTVKILAPTEVLKSSQVITDEYTGATSGIPNVFNVYGFYEGTACGTFGGSEQTEKGMPWNKVKEGIGLLTSAIPVHASVVDYSQDGRLKFKAGLSNGYGLIPEDYTGYFLDLSEIPDGPDYYRVNGTNQDIQQIISTVTDDFGYDYYMELIPVTISSNIAKIIKVRCVNRNTQPSLNAIKTFVNYSDVSGCGVIEKSSGHELRSELTNTLVLGGRKQQMYWVENYSGNWDLSDDLLEPYWGLDPAGDVIHSAIVSGEVVFTGNTTELSFGLTAINFPVTMEFSETELQTAAAGFDAWASYISTATTPTFLHLSGEGITWGGMLDLKHLVGLIENTNNREVIRGSDLVRISEDVITDEQFHDVGRIHEYVETLANDYYGRRYMVRIPGICAYLDGTTNELIFTRNVSEGGWNETGGSEFTNLIGIDTTSAAADFFRTQEGKFVPFVRYNNISGLDFSALSPDQYGAVSGSFDDGSGSGIVGALWVKADVEPDFVFSDVSTLADPRAVVVVPQPVIERQDSSSVINDFAMLVEVLNAINRGAGGDNPETIGKELNERFGGSTFTNPGYRKAIQPRAATIALQNNQEIYGPWIAGTLGAVGTTEVRQDDSLVPWNFGGMTVMNTAGQAIADQGITNMQIAEMGHIRVAGLPTLALGAELLTYDGAGYGAGQRHFVTRTSTSQTVGSVTYYTTDILSAGEWAGNFGPNITSINIDVGPNGITTNYSLKTFTPTFGRFAKYNAERLKELGAMRQKTLSLRQEAVRGGRR